jgi:DNA invertase Pin-like site-specific DNA recombinase
MRAVIYCRVSKDKRDRASVQQQEDESRLAVAALGWTVAEILIDNDVSASRHARKEREFYPALLQLLRDGKADVLVLWETSRGDRDNTRWSALLDLCRDQGVKIHVVAHQRTYDLNVPRDWKELANDGVDNAYASEETRMRILRDVRANAVKGLPHGKLPYGYTRTYTDRKVFIAQVEQPEQAGVVRECGRRVAAGESLYSIAQDLNERAIPAPRGGHWIPTQIKRLVTNPRYVGQRVHQGVVVGEAVWAGILDEQVWAECVRRMADPRRQIVRDTSLKHLLSGSLKAPCGAKMRVQTNRGYLTYVCSADYCTAVRTVPAEDLVTEMIVARLEDPDVLRRLAEAEHGDSAGAEQEADEKQRRLDEFVDSAATGGISPAALAKIEARLVPEIADARRRALAVPVPQLLREVAGPDARARWDRLDLGQQRWLIDRLAELRVTKTVRGSRFSDWRLADSRWIGDERTWGEHWTAEGID